jgi:hypothetical protein
MANGNNAVITKIRDLIEKGGKIDPDTRDILLFSAIVDIYDQLGIVRAETLPAVTFSRIGLWVAGGLGTLLVGLLFAIFTGKVELIFR